MKKEWTALCLALSVLLAGCGGGSPSTPEETATETASEVQAKEEQQEAEDKTEQEQEAPAQTQETTVEAQETTTVKAGSETIEEQVLVDEEGLTITAKSLDVKGFYGPEIKLLIENNTGKNLTVQARNTSVNGYMVETLLSCDVADGKKANDTLVFASSDLKAAGIDVIADMEFSFHVFEMESWDDYFNSEMITLTTSAAEGFEYIFDDSGEAVFDDNGIKIVVKGLSTDDSFFGPGIVLYLENNTDDPITVQTRDVSVNGFMMEPFFSCDICAGKHVIDSITFMSSELEENDISKIEEVDLSFHIFDQESWDTIQDTDFITLQF